MRCINCGNKKTHQTICVDYMSQRLYKDVKLNYRGNSARKLFSNESPLIFSSTGIVTKIKFLKSSAGILQKKFKLVCYVCYHLNPDLNFTIQNYGDDPVERILYSRLDPKMVWSKRQ